MIKNSVGIIATVLAVAALSVPTNADTIFVATMDSAQVVLPPIFPDPPPGLPGTGFGTVVLNTAETQITATVNWANLTSNVTQAHIHGPAPVGVPSERIPFPLFPLSLGDTPKAPTDSAGPVVFSINAEDLAYLKAGLLYFNVHTVNYPGGEIRGQILLQTTPPQAVPEPATMLLLGSGLGGAAARCRRRRGSRRRDD